MDSGEALLKKRLRELSDRAERTGMCFYLGFLSAPELSVALDLSRSGVLRDMESFGGFPDAERRMVRFGGGEEDWPIACVEIAPKSEKFAGQMDHRDVLGALMNLGIEREVLGDQRRDGARWLLFVRQEMAGALTQLTQVRQTPVRCRVLDRAETLPPQEMKRETVLAASERADVLVAELCRLSRSGASELFRREKVFVNGRICPDPGTRLKEGDVFSVRGYGKFVLRGQSGTSKKGRLYLTVDRYV